MSVADQVVVKFIGAAKLELQHLSETAMLFPKPDPFEHGVQVGKYQGVQSALDLLDNILRDSNEKEQA